MAERSRGVKVASGLGKLVVTAGVVTYIVGRLGWSNIMSALSTAEPLWLVAAVGVFLVSGVLGVVQWRILLNNRGVSLPFSRCLSLYFIGMFFNNFMFGMVAGDAVRVTYVKTSSGNIRGGAAATFLDRFAGLMAMACFALIGSAVLVKRGVLEDGRIATAALSLVGAFGLFCFACLFIVSRRVQRAAFWLVDAVPLPWKKTVREMLKAITLEADGRGVVVPVGLLSVVVQLLRIGVHLFCAASLGVLSTSNFQYFFVFVPFLAILMLVPSPFGVKEGIGGSLFVMAGFSPDAPEVPLVMEFLASLVGIVASLAGGVFFVLSRVRTAPTREPL